MGFVILRNISENSEQFSQFQDTFTQKHHKCPKIVRYPYKMKI